MTAAVSYAAVFFSVGCDELSSDAARAIGGAQRGSLVSFFLCCCACPRDQKAGPFSRPARQVKKAPSYAPHRARAALCLGLSLAVRHGLWTSVWV